MNVRSESLIRGEIKLRIAFAQNCKSGLMETVQIFVAQMAAPRGVAKTYEASPLSCSVILRVRALKSRVALSCGLALVPISQ